MFYFKHKCARPQCAARMAPRIPGRLIAPAYLCLRTLGADAAGALVAGPSALLAPATLLLRAPA